MPYEDVLHDSARERARQKELAKARRGQSDPGDGWQKAKRTDSFHDHNLSQARKQAADSKDRTTRSGSNTSGHPPGYHAGKEKTGAQREAVESKAWRHTFAAVPAEWSMSDLLARGRKSPKKEKELEIQRNKDVRWVASPKPNEYCATVKSQSTSKTPVVPMDSSKELPQVPVKTIHGGYKEPIREHPQAIGIYKELTQKETESDRSLRTKAEKLKHMMKAHSGVMTSRSTKSDSHAQIMKRSDTFTGRASHSSAYELPMKHKSMDDTKRKSEQTLVAEVDPELHWVTSCCTTSVQGQPAFETSEIADDVIREWEDELSVLFQVPKKHIFGSDSNGDRFWIRTRPTEPLRPYNTPISNYTYGKTMSMYCTWRYGENAAERLSTWYWRKVLRQECMTPWRGYSGVQYPKRLDDFMGETIVQAQAVKVPDYNAKKKV